MLLMIITKIISFEMLLIVCVPRASDFSWMVKATFKYGLFSTTQAVVFVLGVCHDCCATSY